VTHAIVHRVLWEYLSTINNLSDETESERLRREMFDRYEDGFRMKFCTNLDHSCQEVLAEMVHTRDGSRVVREFLAQGTAKVGFLSAYSLSLG
jgi:pumilio homology domain family member 6